MASSFTHRKLLLSLNNNNNNTNINIPTVETCLYFCNKLKNDTLSTPGYCPTTCLDICPSTCHHSLSTVYNYYTPYQPSIRPHNLSPLLISMLVLLASVFLLITFYVIYTKLCYHFYHFTPHRSSSSGEVTSEEREGTMVFHPIWYLPTVGLNPTVINSIKVIKYEEGVNKESDCAVCLGEFVVGDDLRILPKCNHVFHVPCIDTWLTSHVTCPLCRAPIDPAVDSEYGHTCEISTNNVIRNNNTSAREDESSRDDDVVIAVNYNNNNNNNNNNNVEDCLEGNTKEQGLENNKGSSSQRWSLERRAADLVSRSFSCSGKIFLSRYNNNNSPSPNS